MRTFRYSACLWLYGGVSGDVCCHGVGGLCGINVGEAASWCFFLAMCTWKSLGVEKYARCVEVFGYYRGVVYSGYCMWCFGETVL